MLLPYLTSRPRQPLPLLDTTSYGRTILLQELRGACLEELDQVGGEEHLAMLDHKCHNLC